MRIPIRYGNPWRWLLPLLLLPARSAYIRIDGDVVKHRPVVSIGAHGWNGRWLVNGAHRPIAVIKLAEKSRARVVGFPVKLTELLVSVDDRDMLRELLVR